MQQVVSAMTGTTAIAFPLSSGLSSCSQLAKKELKSTNNQFTAIGCNVDKSGG
jgi:hypothetical protein